jgi:hypothetical protein
MNATESAAAIRVEYKRKGWTPKDVSVRSEYFSMGEAVRITIKSAAVPLRDARAIAEKYDRMRRCEYSGEILSGGNLYVSVSVSEEARKAKAAQFVPAVERAIALLNPDDNILQPIVPGYHVGRNPNTSFSLWGESRHIIQASNAAEIAYELAVALEGGKR